MGRRRPGEAAAPVEALQPLHGRHRVRGGLGGRRAAGGGPHRVAQDHPLLREPGDPSAGHCQQAGSAPGAGRRGDREAAGLGRAQPLHAVPRPAGLRHYRGGSGGGHGPAVRDDREEEEVTEAEEEEAVTEDTVTHHQHFPSP